MLLATPLSTTGAMPTPRTRARRGRSVQASHGAHVQFMSTYALQSTRPAPRAHALGTAHCTAESARLAFAAAGRLRHIAICARSSSQTMFTCRLQVIRKHGRVNDVHQQQFLDRPLGRVRPLVLPHAASLCLCLQQYQLSPVTTRTLAFQLDEAECMPRVCITVQQRMRQTTHAICSLCSPCSCR